MFYILAIAVYVFSMIIQARLTSTFNKYSKVMSTRGMSADEAAKRILNGAGVSGLVIKPVKGSLTDTGVPALTFYATTILRTVRSICRRLFMVSDP